MQTRSDPHSRRQRARCGGAELPFDGGCRLFSSALQSRCSSSAPFTDRDIDRSSSSETSNPHRRDRRHCRGRDHRREWRQLEERDEQRRRHSGGGRSQVRHRHGDRQARHVPRRRKGRTLYLFEADKPSVSNCSGACLSIWLALGATGKAPAVKGGAVAAKLGATTPGHGKSIVAYNGHPFYYYAGDQKPGQTAGQGLKQFGAEWYVVAPAGNKIDNG
jgi:predicted lipoprotein with Yx(FWY)xxD motif